MADFLKELYIFDKDEFYENNESFEFVAFRDTILIVDDSDDWDEISGVIDGIDQDWTEEFKEELRDQYELTRDGDFNPNVILGYVSGETMFLYSNNSFTLDPKSSLFIKKVAKELGMRKVALSSEDRGPSGEKEDELEISIDEVKGKIPDIAYHGTNSDAFLSILKTGLRPGGTMGKSNWKKQNIIHNEAISLVFSKHKSSFHAYNSCKGREEFAFPVIFGVKIPDKDKIMPDYDVDSGSSKTHYEDIRTIVKNIRTQELGYEEEDEEGDLDFIKKQIDSLKASLQVGVIGYKGRIPSSFIVEIYAFMYDAKEWELIDKERFLEMDEIVSTYGMEMQRFTREDIKDNEEDYEDDDY